MSNQISGGRANGAMDIVQSFYMFLTGLLPQSWDPKWLQKALIECVTASVLEQRALEVLNLKLIDTISERRVRINHAQKKLKSIMFIMQ